MHSTWAKAICASASFCFAVLFAIETQSAEGSTITNNSFNWYQWPSDQGGNNHWYGFSKLYLRMQAIRQIDEQWEGTLANLTEAGELDFVSARGAELRNVFLTGLAAEPGEMFRWPDGTVATLEFMEAQGRSATNTGPHAAAYFLGTHSSILDLLNNAGGYRAVFELTNHPSSLPPVLVYVPTNSEHYSINPATFSAFAVGAEPIRYQWYVGETAIPGETNAQYTMQLTTLSTGAVSVVVSNANGVLRSPPLELEIIPLEFSGRMGWAQWRVEHGGNDHWYGLWADESIEGKSWLELRSLAQQVGSDLVALETEAEWKRLADFSQSSVSPYPLGLSDSATEGEFSWVNGAPLVFQRWATNEPANSDSDADFGIAAPANFGVAPEWRVVNSSAKFQIAWFERTNSPSHIAPLILSDPPAAPLRMSVGSTLKLEFDVVAGTGAVYEWQLNGQLYSRGTAPLLNLRPTSTKQSGLYQLIVRNAFGAATSGPINISVFVPEPISIIPIMKPNLNQFELHFDFPSDADKVILEYSFDLVEWLPSGERTRDVGHYFATGDTLFSPQATSRYFRLLRQP
jgi:hypothetical protein